MCQNMYYLLKIYTVKLAYSEFLGTPVIVFPHCVAKSRNSAGVNFCTNYDDYMTFTWSSALPWTYWKGTVIQGEMSRVPVDLTVIICFGIQMKQAKGGDTHPSNIDTTI